MDEPPVARGVFLCEQVIVEERTKNVSLVNCFTRRLVPDFPSPAQRFVVFALFTNGSGIIPVDLEIVRLADESLVYSRNVNVDFPRQLVEVRFIYRLDGLVLSDAGSYELSLSAKGEPLGRTRFDMAKRPGG